MFGPSKVGNSLKTNSFRKSTLFTKTKIDLTDLEKLVYTNKNHLVAT